MAKVTLDQVMEAIERDDNIGICIACGAENSPVEPDARGYRCESCGEPKVYGAEELLLRVAL
jgi:ribosomal protein L40E